MLSTIAPNCSLLIANYYKCDRLWCPTSTNISIKYYCIILAMQISKIKKRKFSNKNENIQFFSSKSQDQIPEEIAIAKQLPSHSTTQELSDLTQNQLNKSRKFLLKTLISMLSAILKSQPIFVFYQELLLLSEQLSNFYLKFLQLSFQSGKKKKKIKLFGY